MVQTCLANEKAQGKRDRPSSTLSSNHIQGDKDCVPVVSFYGTTASGIVIRYDPGARNALLNCPRQTVAINWYSRLVIMQQPSRTQKRGVPPEKMPSSAALEVTAVVQEDGPPKKGKKGKKRATRRPESTTSSPHLSHKRDLPIPQAAALSSRDQPMAL